MNERTDAGRPVRAGLGSSNRLALGLVTALLITAAARPAGATVDQRYQTWIGGFVQGPIGWRLLVQSDVHYRAWSDFSPSAVLVRPGLGLRLREGMSATLGYAFVGSWAAPGGEGFAPEHRIWQQFTYEYSASGTGLRLQTRTRLEQRFRHPAGEVEVGARIREMLRLSLPIAAARRLLFVVWDEVFFAFNDAGGTVVEGAAPTARWQSAGFDQNRLFVGLGYQVIPERLRFELGYFNDYVRRPVAPAGDLVIHAAMANTYVGWP